VKDTYAAGHPYLAGETVTPGTFECERCGHELEIADGKITNLPVCPHCQHDRWKPG